MDYDDLDEDDEMKTHRNLKNKAYLSVLQEDLETVEDNIELPRYIIRITKFCNYRLFP